VGKGDVRRNNELPDGTRGKKGNISIYAKNLPKEEREKPKSEMEKNKRKKGDKKKMGTNRLKSSKTLTMDFGGQEVSTRTGGQKNPPSPKKWKRGEKKPRESALYWGGTGTRRCLYKDHVPRKNAPLKSENQDGIKKSP